MVNAKNLPGEFSLSTWTVNHVQKSLIDYWIASMPGSGGMNEFVLTTESDAIRVDESTFNAIAGATVDNGGAGPFLLIGGETREVYAYPGSGGRWLGLREPEE